MKPQWTAPHYGVQHLGQFGTTTFWCTVTDYGTFATLYRWSPGCGFSPIESQHLTAENARKVGADWLAGIVARKGMVTQ